MVRPLFCSSEYMVDDRGFVLSKRGKPLKPSINHDGYQIVNLMIDGKRVGLAVHMAVARAFCDGFVEGLQVNHIDGVKTNNTKENLEWVTPSENTQHAVETGLMSNGRKKAVIQYNLNGDKMATFESASEAARQTGGSQSKITMCCRRQRESANDYQWRYFDDIQDVQKIEKKFITGKQVAQCDEEGKVLNIYPSFKEAARAVNGTSSAISRVCSGTNIRHKGYKWKLVEEIVQEDI